jgi:protein-S-isoprenylcysteine O-methyltransferase Ste14
MNELVHTVSQSFFFKLPPWAQGGVLVMVAYIIVAEIRFGAKARSSSAGAADRGSTRAVSLAAMVPVVGFVVTMQLSRPEVTLKVPAWLRSLATLPGMPAVAWAGVVVGALGVLLRLWALLVLRERFTRTLMVHETHEVERSGPFRFARHPGYLGSLLCLNGIALASGNAFVLLGSLIATSAAYAYRIRVEDEMLVAAFGESYERYRREVGALIPFVR